MTSPNNEAKSSVGNLHLVVKSRLGCVKARRVPGCLLRIHLSVDSAHGIALATSLAVADSSLSYTLGEKMQDDDQSRSLCAGPGEAGNRWELLDAARKLLGGAPAVSYGERTVPGFRSAPLRGVRPPPMIVSASTTTKGQAA